MVKLLSTKVGAREGIAETARTNDSLRLGEVLGLFFALFRYFFAFWGIFFDFLARLRS